MKVKRFKPYLLREKPPVRTDFSEFIKTLNELYVGYGAKSGKK